MRANTAINFHDVLYKWDRAVIDRMLRDITYDDIAQLVHDNVPEGKSIDYKRDTYNGPADENKQVKRGNTEASQKRELANDACSFANAQGGDIVIGVDEKDSFPTATPGIKVPSIERECSRLSDIIRSNVSPRLECHVHHISTLENTWVIVLRVPPSVYSPHAFKNNEGRFEFYSRSSKGKFQMDIEEIRRAFVSSESAVDRMKAFREQRVDLIRRRDVPYSLPMTAKLVMHLIPVSAFRTTARLMANELMIHGGSIPLLGLEGGAGRLNFDGFLKYHNLTDEPGRSYYTQLFRDGSIESVITDVLLPACSNTPKRLLPKSYEGALVRDGYFCQYLASMRSLNIQPPVWCCISLTGVKDATLQIGGENALSEHAIDRDVLHLPEFRIDDFESFPYQLLARTLDIVWNAAGKARSQHLDDAVDWIGD